MGIKRKKRTKKVYQSKSERLAKKLQQHVHDGDEGPEGVNKPTQQVQVVVKDVEMEEMEEMEVNVKIQHEKEYMYEQVLENQVCSYMQCNCSSQWDLAVGLLLSSKGTPQVIRLKYHVVQALVQSKQVKAALHYLKRLFASQLQSKNGDELEGLLEKCTAKSTDDCVATVQFLRQISSDDPEKTLIVNRFLFPFVIKALQASDGQLLQVCLHGNRALQRRFMQHCFQYGIDSHVFNQYANCCDGWELSTNMNVALSSAIERYHQQHKPSALELERRYDLKERILQLIQLVWPDAVVYIFGSTSLQFCSSVDDLDLCLVIPSCGSERSDILQTLQQVHEHLQAYFVDVEQVTTSRIPLIRLQDTMSTIKCDICLNNVAALWNTQYLIGMMTFRPHIRALIFFIRHWAKSRLATHRRHMISSYSIVLMVVYTLQRQNVLPTLNLENIAHLLDLQASTIHRIPTVINEMIAAEQSSTMADFKATLLPASDESNGRFLLEFFRFWAADFKYAKDVASLRTSVCVLKVDRKWESSKDVLSLEDPVEVTRDLGCCLSRHTQKVLRCELLRSCLLCYSKMVEEGNQVVEEKDGTENSPPRLVKEGRLIEWSSSFLVLLSRRRDWKVSTTYVMAGDHLPSALPGIEVEDEEENVHLVDCFEKVHEATQQLSKYSLLALDCEGAKLSRFGKLSTVQIAAGNNVYIFDMLCRDHQLLAEALKPILEDINVTKITHDCRNDSDALFHQYHVRLSNVFDIQVAHRVMERDQHARALKYKQTRENALPSETKDGKLMTSEDVFILPMPSLGYLTSRYLAVHLHDKQKISEAMTQSNAVWMQRPLTEKLISYARDDVKYLLGVYQVMTSYLHFASIQSKIYVGTIQYVNVRNFRYEIVAEADVRADQRVHGLVNNVTKHGVYVQLNEQCTGLLQASSFDVHQLLTNDASEDFVTDFGVSVGQLILVRVLSTTGKGHPPVTQPSPFIDLELLSK